MSHANHKLICVVILQEQSRTTDFLEQNGKQVNQERVKGYLSIFLTLTTKTLKIINRHIVILISIHLFLETSSLGKRSFFKFAINSIK